MDLLRSPLHERHVALGAKFAEFGGWEMPLEYAGGGVLAEHKAVREGVGVFDVSHLGRALVRGPGALEFVNSCLTNDLHRIRPGKAQYTLCCNESGGVVDDLIAYVRGESEIFLVPNAANTAEVVRLLRAAAPAEVEVVNQHRDFVVLAVQGPCSEDLLSSLGLPVAHDYMSFVEGTVAKRRAIVCRTGYTGEHGYELVVPAAEASEVWDAVLDAGPNFELRVCGLASRDTLRTEMGYALHGHELSSQISPVMAGSGWAVGWKKPRFWGREALLSQKESGPLASIRGLKALGRGIPREGMMVSSPTGRALGEVTSGTFSPTLRQGIALALLEPGVADGSQVLVDIRGRLEAFEVVKPPFVHPTT